MIFFILFDDSHRYVIESSFLAHSRENAWLRPEIWNLSCVIESFAATIGLLLPFVDTLTRSFDSSGWGIR